MHSSCSTPFTPPSRSPQFAPSVTATFTGRKPGDVFQAAADWFRNDHSTPSPIITSISVEQRYSDELRDDDTELLITWTLHR